MFANSTQSKLKEAKNINILICGVGGQGLLAAGNIIGSYYVSKGLDVKISEVHGMAQRGGSVITHIKCAEKVYSPLIEKGEADYILAFETLEAARWIEYLSPSGTMLVNNQQIYPVTVLNDKSKYPKFAFSGCDNVKVYDALEVAEKSGSTRAVNVVMLGFFAAQSGGDFHLWTEAIKNSLSGKILDINIKAFTAAYNIGTE